MFVGAGGWPRHGGTSLGALRLVHCTSSSVASRRTPFLQFVCGGVTTSCWDMLGATPCALMHLINTVSQQHFVSSRKTRPPRHVCGVHAGQRLPTAVAPTPGGADADGCFSGSIQVCVSHLGVWPPRYPFAVSRSTCFVHPSGTQAAPTDTRHAIPPPPYTATPSSHSPWFPNPDPSAAPQHVCCRPLSYLSTMRSEYMLPPVTPTTGGPRQRRPHHVLHGRAAAPHRHVPRPAPRWRHGPEPLRVPVLRGGRPRWGH